MPDLSAPVVLAAVTDIREDEKRFDTNGVDVLIGQTVADLGATRSMLGVTVPREWERVATVLSALLERHPFREGPRYSGERIILGALAAELHAYALAAGEPTGEVDLRAPEVVAGERRLLSHAV